MKLNKYLYILFILFFLIDNQVAIASRLDKPSDTSTLNYFREKIENYQKTADKALGKGKSIKSYGIEAAQEKVWNLWKRANHDIDELPIPMVATDNLKDFPINHWTLQDEDPMPFYYFTKGEQPEAGYPLFLNLHGSGPKAGEFQATLSWSLKYKDSPSLYFIPQIPNEQRYRWWFKPEQYAWEKLFRLAMLSGNVDANKIYVMGISEGGYGSQRLGAFYADYLAGAGPMAGGEPLKNAPPLNYRNIAFSFQTGEKDTGFGRNKLTGEAKSMFDSLAKAHPNKFINQIELQTGKGHSIDYTVTTPWLIQHKRNPQPSSVSWVLFPMHGRYRSGFYNIGIDKPLNISENSEFDRAVFNLTIDKGINTINLEVWLQDGDANKVAAVKDGEISIYLSPKLVDLSKKVRVFYKGKLIYNKKVRLDENVLVESCALFGDPERLFPTKIKVVL